ncbi:10199_t:CDS:2 [Racocetra fulgida]|uniref:10199_t:CDS:1 n=1 Tax=Racocetra fulgida TaxID=60492 RepID=A0A9N8ZLZ0_9GLOM|nr:10199_t:CDS:2 [Racocetra fulgida]
MVINSPMIESPIVESPMVESPMVKSLIVEDLIIKSLIKEIQIEVNQTDKTEEALHKFETNLTELEANFEEDINRDHWSEIDPFTVIDDTDEQEIVQPSTVIDEFDKVLLQQFYNKVAKLKHKSCPICNERFSSITLAVKECRRCYNEKTLLKKFSFDNDMDPKKVPEEFKELTEIEEMLIAQVFPVIVVYRLCKGQHRYRGNVINFSQDVEKFTTRLPWHPSSLNVLIICQQSNRDLTVFRDFKLKMNNTYYSDIIIDDENLQSLLEDSFINDQLQINQLVNNEFNEENEKNVITSTFVPFLLQFQKVYKLNTIQHQSDNSEEQKKFRDILLRLHNGKSTITDWKTLDINLINTDKLRSLNIPDTKILAVHQRGGKEAKNADSDEAGGLEVELLLSRGASIMLTANLWTEARLVNSSMGTIQDILFEEDQSLPLHPIAVFIIFDNYTGPIISTVNGTKVIPIVPIQRK